MTTSILDKDIPQTIQEIIGWELKTVSPSALAWLLKGAGTVDWDSDPGDRSTGIAGGTCAWCSMPAESFGEDEGEPHDGDTLIAEVIIPFLESQLTGEEFEPEIERTEDGTTVTVWQI